VTVVKLTLKKCFARGVVVETSMFPSDNTHKTKTLVTKLLEVGADGVAQYKYDFHGERKHLGAKFNVNLARPFVVIQMIIRHGRSAQTLLGSIDLAKETKQGTRKIWVELTGNNALPNATTCKVRIHLGKYF
jgi:hypothetical protein